jgi:hypothetical protein
MRCTNKRDLKNTIVKITVFWDVLCSQVETDRPFCGAYCLLSPDDGFSKHL